MHKPLTAILLPSITKLGLKKLIRPRPIFGLERLQCTSCLKKQAPLRILYFGSDIFSLGPLKKLLSKLRKPDGSNNYIDSLHVVTSEPPIFVKGKKKQKSQEFIEYIKKNNLEIHKWNKDEISKQAEHFDFGVVASFGHLIPKRVIANFKRGIINAHPSLLPRWRGAAPIIHTVLNGDRTTGVTIIDLSFERFDRGNIFAQNQINIDQKITTEELTENLANLAGEMVLDVIEHFDDYQKNKFTQPDSNDSYASKISSELSYIKWKHHTCDYIDRLHRAIGAKIGIHAFWKEKIMKFVDLQVVGPELACELDARKTEPWNEGQVIFDKQAKNLYIKCIDGWIAVSKLQVQYKKPITASDFYNAYMLDRKAKGILHEQFS